MKSTSARRRSEIASIALAIAASLLSPFAAWAQRGSSVHGTVTNAETHAPVMGARVAILSPERVAITNENGPYILRDVPAGKYNVFTSAIGRKPDSTSVT